MSVSLSQDAPVTEKVSAALRTFSSLAVITLVSPIVLIMVGAIVRVTGNGLGCPDWPLCHGRAVPPFLLSAWVEFLHRLFGAAVVLEVGALIVMSWRWFKPDILFISRGRPGPGPDLAMNTTARLAPKSSIRPPKRTAGPTLWPR